MDTLRSKNDFAFESDDFNLPYMVEKVLVGTQRVAAFNYSSEYFRKKKGSDKGIYQIVGGNIPSDMNSTEGFSFEDGDLSCALNAGTGRATHPIQILNLTPNRIKYVPYLCEPSGKIVKGATSSPISKEAGKDQKPNHMYIPVYQHSCSDHPRAKGFAHEDHYGCLFYYQGQPPPEYREQQSCCNDVSNCIQSVHLFTTVTSNGVTSYQAMPVNTFSCLDGGGTENTPEAVLRRINCENKKSCNAGFWFNSSSQTANGPCLETEPSATRFLGNCPDGGAGWKLASSQLSIIYRVTGAEDCGCKSGIPQISGRTDCAICSYCEKDLVTGAPTGNTKVERHCQAGGGSANGKYCGCVFNLEEPGVGTLSTLFSPNFSFPNWSKLEFTGKVAAPVDSCGEERQFLTCKDVS